MPYKICEGCPDPQPYGKKILIINLDAIGDVLMTTAQLPAIKRAYPESTIFWLTAKMPCRYWRTIRIFTKRSPGMTKVA
ncbi:MAG: hypothetical protein Q9P14_12270 [candidate division KSB1 bacterium]|nr:hypothetical protein [candidate division KSB1 bacterium]